MTTVLERETEEVLEVRMESDTCPQCGTPIPAGTLEAHLPDCPGKIVVQEIRKVVPTKFPKYPEPDVDTYVSPWETSRHYVPKRTTRGRERIVRRGNIRKEDRYVRSSGYYSTGSNHSSRMC